MADRRRVDPVWLARSAAVFGSVTAAIAAFAFSCGSARPKGLA